VVDGRCKSNLTIKVATGETAVLSPTDTSFAAFLCGVYGLTIQGFEITGMSYAIYIEDGAHRLQFLNNTIHDQTCGVIIEIYHILADVVIAGNTFSNMAHPPWVALSLWV